MKCVENKEKNDLHSQARCVFQLANFNETRIVQRRYVEIFCILFHLYRSRK